MARQRTDARRTSRRPATTPEGRELQLVSKAYDLAEEQIESGTASSQVVTHFLKAGSMRERLEQQRMDHEIELMKVRRQQIEGQAKIEELYVKALDAMRSYSGELHPGSVDGSIDE